MLKEIYLCNDIINPQCRQRLWSETQNVSCCMASILTTDALCLANLNKNVNFLQRPSSPILFIRGCVLVLYTGNNFKLFVETLYKYWP